MATYQTITDLLPLQEELDKQMLERMDKTRGETFEHRVIALRCQFYSFINEWGGFQYWRYERSNTVSKSNEVFTDSEECLIFAACDVLGLLLALNFDTEPYAMLSLQQALDYEQKAPCHVHLLDDFAVIEIFEQKLSQFELDQEMQQLGEIIHVFLHLCRRFGITEKMLIEGYLISIKSLKNRNRECGEIMDA